MSTTPNGDGEDRRLPATWEEYQRARREAFEAGADHAENGWTGTLVEAHRRYPITKRVPRTLRDDAPARVEWKYDGGHFLARCGGDWVSASCYVVTPDRVRVWAELLENPFDEVTE